MALALSVAALAATPSHAAVTQLALPGFDATQGYVTAGRTADGSINSVYVELPTAQTWNTSWSVVVSAKGSTLTGALTLMGLYMQDTQAGHENNKGISEGAKMSGGNLTLTTWSQAAITKSGVDFTSYDNITFVMSRDSSQTLTLSAYDSSDFAAGPLFTLQREGQTFGNHALEGFVLGALGTHTKYSNNNNQVAFTADSSVGSYSVTKAGFSSGTVASALDLANYYYSDAKNLTWNGGASGNWDGDVWTDAEGNAQSFVSNDSVTFATEGAQVTLTGATTAKDIAIEENAGIELAGNTLKAAGLAVADGKTFTLAGEGSATVADLSGGAVSVDGSSLSVSNAISNTALTVTNGGSVSADSLSGGSANVDGSALTVAESLSNTTLTVTNNGSVSANSISGSSVTVSNGATLSLTGRTLSNTTVTGALTLSGNERVSVTGSVTLGTVLNNLTASDQGYAFIGGADAILKFTGTTDLTKKGDGVTSTGHSKIGLGGGRLIVASDASLTTLTLINSSTTKTSNAKVEVEERGTLVMSGSGQNYLVSLVSSGSVTAGSGNTRAHVYVHNQVDNTGSLTANTLEIANTGGLTSTLGGTVNVTKLQLDSGKATVSGAVTANQITGLNANNVAVLDVGNSGTLTLTGSVLTNATVNGPLTLTHNGRVSLTGNVTLGSIVNNLAGTDTYAFVGTANTNLTFTGKTDLTKKGNGAGAVRSLIGLNSTCTIVVNGGASLKSGGLYNSASDSASIHVKEGGSVELTGFMNGDTAMSAYAKTLTNEGVMNAATLVHVNHQLINTGTLTAGTLQIANGSDVEATLDGTVNVGTLNLDNGTAVLSGNVTAGKVTDSGAGKTGTYVGAAEGTGTLTITGASTDATCGSTLRGNFTVVKQGTNKQTFTGSGNKDFAGSLTVEGGTLDLTKIHDTTLLALKDISISNGSTLGLYTSDTADAASLATISINRLTSGAAAATTRSADAANAGGTLNANVVMNNTSDLVLDSTLALGGSLTLDGAKLSGALFDSLYQGATSITLFTGVTSLTIGSGSAILPGSLTETNEEGTLCHPFTSEELAAAFRNGFDPNVFHVSYVQEAGGTGGSIIMTANVPEPATATLSLLALAGLCARRRRK